MILLKPLKKIEEGRGVGKREFTIAFFCRVEGLPPPPPSLVSLSNNIMHLCPCKKSITRI